MSYSTLCVRSDELTVRLDLLPSNAQGQTPALAAIVPMVAIRLVLI